MARPRRNIVHINYQQLAGLQEEEDSPPADDGLQTGLALHPASKLESGLSQVNQTLHDKMLVSGCSAAPATEPAICCVCGRTRQVSPLTEGRRQQLAAVSRGRLLASAAVCLACRADVEAIGSRLTDLEAKLDKRDAVGSERSLLVAVPGRERSCLLCGQQQLGASSSKQLGKRGQTAHQMLQDLVGFNLRPEAHGTCLCFPCLRLLQEVDWLREETARISQDVCASFLASQDRREQQLLGGPAHAAVLRVTTVWVQAASGSAAFRLEPSAMAATAAVRPLQDLEIVDSDSIVNEFRNCTLRLLQHQLNHLGVIDCVGESCCVRLVDVVKLGATFLLEEASSTATLVVDLTTDRSSGEDSEKYACGTCNAAFPFFHNLYAHLDSHRRQQQEEASPDRLYNCQSCERAFDHKYEFKSHSLVCKRDLGAGVRMVECPTCGKLFRTQEGLAVHIAKDHEGSATPWTCRSCNKGFTRKASYEEHLARHKGIRDRRCTICNKDFYETAYWRHMSLVHPSQERLLRHRCSACGKRFPQLGRLRQHSLVHLADSQKDVACPQCDKRFASQGKLRNHQRTVHRDREEGATFACSECGVTYSNYSSMCSHIKRCHEAGLPRPLACPECPQSYPSQASLQKHLTLHHGSQRLFTCGFGKCGASFFSISDLQSHHHSLGHANQEEEDDEERVIFLGEIISGEESRTSMEQALNLSIGNIDSRVTGADREEGAIGPSAHHQPIFTLQMKEGEEEGLLILTENEAKDFLDPILTHSQETDLSKAVDFTRCESHLLAEEQINSDSLAPGRLKHTKPADHPHVCSLCEKKFSTKKNLIRHVRIHTGERPFVCEFCFKKFGAASNLSEHRTLHTGRKPYSCAGCGSAFRLWSSLKKHSVKCEGGKDDISAETGI